MAEPERMIVKPLLYDHRVTELLVALRRFRDFPHDDGAEDDLRRELEHIFRVLDAAVVQK